MGKFSPAKSVASRQVGPNIRVKQASAFRPHSRMQLKGGEVWEDQRYISEHTSVRKRLT